MSRKIGYDLLDKPELACNPEIATRIACEYFKERGLFELADNWDIEEITKRVNGSAKLHLRERLEYSNAALKVLEKLQPQP
jgi:putative chitinase